MMRGLRIVLLASAACSGVLCARADALGLHADARIDEGSSPAQAESPVSPCEDSLYVALKSKPVGSMTFAEYTYFMAKSGECYEHERGTAPVPHRLAPVQAPPPPPVEVRRRTPTAVHAAIVGAMLAAVVYLVAKG